MYGHLSSPAKQSDNGIRYLDPVTESLSPLSPNRFLRGWQSPGHDRFFQLLSVVSSILLNDAAIIRLVGILVIEQTEEWHLTRRYMSYESLAKVVKPESAERLLEKQAVA